MARGQRGAIVPDANNEPALVLVNVVSPNFFEALGVHAAIGRVPGSADRDPVVALGHSYWKTRFAGDPLVVGRTLPLGTQGAVTATIVGVLPESFRELEPAADRDIWMPPVTWTRLALSLSSASPGQWSTRVHGRREVELSMSNDVPPFDADMRAQMKHWLDDWKRLGPMLEQERWDHVVALTDAEAQQAAVRLFALWRPDWPTDNGEGLLLHQRVFARARHGA
jgi:hypothetical protein